jgi:glycerol-3-phosphate acyltransferase PlsX
MPERVTVAVDAMGGDHAPDVVVDGAIQATADLQVRVLLVGQRARIEPLLAGRSGVHHVEIADAAEVIEMDEHPASAVRQKPESSIAVGARLVRAGRAQALVSAGNTGAVMAAGLFELRRLTGIERPALAAPFPTQRGTVLLIDVGANADCRPEYLAQFGLMGAAYMKGVFGVAEPTVGLISIGEEETKGNALVQQTHPKLRELPIRFVGNVEGKDVTAGLVDVAVCDGFVGNVLLKFAEGMATTITGIIREEVERSLWSKVVAAGLLPAFRRARKRMDYAEFGGAPLLGLNGICIVAHGRSNAMAIKSAVRAAAEAVRQGVISQIEAAVQGTEAPAETSPVGSEN